MCGIIGIVSGESVVDRLVDGLRRMEYRGYDSAGVCTLDDGRMVRRRAQGKLANLVEVLAKDPAPGTIGIAHTRWATHGAPTAANAHPHAGKAAALVHNGIIENFRPLRDELLADGYAVESETDSEVVALLVSREVERGASPEEAVQTVLPRLRGAFALAILFPEHPDKIIGARLGSPLVVGYGDGEMFVGSDALALAPLTQRISYLEEGDWAVVTREGAQIFDIDGHEVEREIVASGASAAAVERGNYRHFMQKEIFEQPTVVAQTLASYVRQADQTVALPQMDFDLSSIERMTIVACGTSYYAGMVGKYWIEEFARVPVDIDVASEFRYREPPLPKGGLALFISQSGETADTLAAKLAVVKGRMDRAEEEEVVRHLLEAPAALNSALDHDDDIAAMAHLIAPARDVLYLGRGPDYPMAMEGALKLKEISYIHAEGYASGEMKHGPIALIDEHVPVIVIAPSGPLFEKTVSNMQEVRARGGKIVLISDREGLEEAGEGCLATIEMPRVHPLIAPLVYAVPVQLLAYHVALVKGTDVDQPRNLAKSVTVE